MPTPLESVPPVMSLSELTSEIIRYAYRPGWELSVFLDKWEGPCLYVEMTVPDGYDSTKTTKLRVRSNIPPMRDKEAFAEWLQWRLIQIEIHESREFLRRDGKLLFDPHKPIEPVSQAELDAENSQLPIEPVSQAELDAENSENNKRIPLFMRQSYKEMQ